MAKTDKQLEFEKKYAGRRDLVKDESFWREAFVVWADTNLQLPVQFNPTTVRLIMGWLKCSPGQCAGCCNYPIVHVTDYDLVRMKEGGANLSLLTRTPEGMIINCVHGCPYLKDRACSIYEVRPDTCYYFPMQRVQLEDGTFSEQMFMRIRCAQGNAVIRRILTQFVKDTGYILLPTLRTVRGI